MDDLETGQLSGASTGRNAKPSIVTHITFQQHSQRKKMKIFDWYRSLCANLTDRFNSVVASIQSSTEVALSRHHSSQNIFFFSLSICSILTVILISVQHCLTFLPSIVNCNDVPIAIDENKHRPKSFTLNHYFSEHDQCSLMLRHYNRISSLIVLVLISTTLSHLKLSYRFVIQSFYFALFIVLNLLSFDNNSTLVLTKSLNSSGSKYQTSIEQMANLEPNSFASASITMYNVCFTSILFGLFFIFVIYSRDRHAEFSSRLHQLWKAKLQVEQEDVETIGGINKILLENILPQHVAQHFLLNNYGPNRTLYHERLVHLLELGKFFFQRNFLHFFLFIRYNSVAVMFASIPNYHEFYDENDVNKQGLECLRLLNEIICDFDKLLLKPKFSCIEKIKTIGSTYMAAAGLQPGRESFEKNGVGGSSSGSFKLHHEEHNVISLVEFSIAMNNVLQQINRESFQRFRLRVGSKFG